MERIIHLREREKALETEWGVRDAEWIALVCLHSGAFTRTQYQAYFGAHPEQTRRFVRRMVDRKMATEADMPQPWGRPLQVCHITHKRLYRALGVPNIRHRREADVDVLYRRLVSLDYVIEHPDFEWLPTESEKAGGVRRRPGARAADTAAPDLWAERERRDALFPRQAADCPDPRTANGAVRLCRSGL